MNVKYIKLKHINEGHGGFNNPFEDDVTMTKDDIVITDKNDPILNCEIDKDNNIICGVRAWNTNTLGKTYHRTYKLNGDPNNDEIRMFAGQFFHKGDIIEEAPVRIMHEDDMYSNTIRDVCFLVDPRKRLYALPIGYSSCYRNSYNSNKEGNIDYDYDEESKTIKFYAIKNIKRNDELILLATNEDFGNVIKPGQFKYEQGLEPANTISNINIK